MQQPLWHRRLGGGHPHPPIRQLPRDGYHPFMLILIDEAVPGATDLFSGLGDVRTFSGRSVSAPEMADADALIVRSVTRVDADLLAGSKVRFVGSATSGTDHIDRDWLTGHGIQFAAAEGCNSRPVAEYVLTAIMLLADRRGFDPKGKTLGVVGVGRIGSIVADWAAALGMRVLRCDPPRQETQGGESWADRDEVLDRSDIVTLHVPLTVDGANKTHEMVDEAWLSAMRDGGVFINTSRGEVVDEEALWLRLLDGRLGGAVLDVWCGEPDISGELVRMCEIATPHLAGHSQESKRRAAARVFRALAAWSNSASDVDGLLRRFEEDGRLSRTYPKTLVEPASSRCMTGFGIGSNANREAASPPSDGGADAQRSTALQAMLRACNIVEIDNELKRAAKASALRDRFDGIRARFSTRREFPFHRLPICTGPADAHAGLLVFLEHTGFSRTC